MSDKSKPRVLNLRDTGGKVPEGAVRIDNTTIWGNPAWSGLRIEGKNAVNGYRAWLEVNPAVAAKVSIHLRGKNLACWCAPEACHGDVLLKIANRKVTG